MLLRGEFCFCLVARFCESFRCFCLDCSCYFSKCWRGGPGTKRRPCSRRCRVWTILRCGRVILFGQMGLALGRLLCCVFGLSGCRSLWSTADGCWVVSMLSSTRWRLCLLNLRCFAASLLGRPSCVM